MTRQARRMLPAMLAAVLAAGCAHGGNGTTPTTPTTPATPPARPANDPGALSESEFEAIYRARTDSSRMRFTADDVHFMTGMIGHHAQALVMVSLAPSRTSTASIRTLAARIENSQKDEIAIMERWLRNRGQSVPEVHIDGTSLMIHGADHAMHMPGMLTDAQLKELEQARGAAFDRLFLTFMIQHHRGAVTMVRELFTKDGAAQDEDAFRLATDVQVDQLTEIARMERMLTAMSAGGVEP